MQPLQLALIGAGRMARTHAQVLAGVSSVRITKVCDAVTENAERLASALDATPTTALTEVLEDPNVAAVLITTPTASHAALITQAATAGKHIFVEKPPAADLTGAARALTAVEEAGVQCQVGFQRRYDPSYLEAKRKIEAGELGRLEGFRAVGRDAFLPPIEFLETSGGLMLDMGIHDLDSARFLVGEVAEVHCVGAVQTDERLRPLGLFDAAVATLRFRGGALGTLEVGLRTVYGYEVRAEVLGEKGRLHLEMDSAYHLRQYGEQGGFFERPRNFQERFQQGYVDEIRAFATNIAAGKPVTPTVRDAMETLRLALAAQHSLESGKIVAVQSFGKEVSR